jgi:transcriptional/translational regulatory protein YebC/TACO1
MKRHKAVIDAKRGKTIGTLGKDIFIAAPDGGDYVNFNARSRVVVQKAKEATMLGDNIKKAIQKDTGELPGIIIEELTYERYVTGEVPVIVEVTTDHQNRAVSGIRGAPIKGGGNVMNPVALTFNCQRMG